MANRLPPPRAHWFLLLITLMVLVIGLGVDTVLLRRVGPSGHELPPPPPGEAAPAQLREGGPVIDARNEPQSISVPDKTMVLTFDDGPDPLTGRYLDLLDELGVPATFFVLGASVAALPGSAGEYLRRGHQVASHGYDHTRFTVLGRRALLDQGARTERVLGGQITGRPWVRPPHGSLDTGALVTLLTAGYTVAMWTLDACDYSDHDPASPALHLGASGLLGLSAEKPAQPVARLDEHVVGVALRVVHDGAVGARV